MAIQLQSDADRDGIKFDVANWLRDQFADAELTLDDLVSACDRASDRMALRKELNLDYERFNRVLLELGESPLSNEDELRQLYDAYLVQMRSEIIDRLRRRHAADFRNGLDLAAYVDRKTLAFLPFDPKWILTRETLEMEIVEAHVSDLLDETLGEDQAVDLPALSRLIERNRKTAREFATQAIPVVRVWCRRNQDSVPEPWQHGEPQPIARYLENSGLLDFRRVSVEQLPSLCRRAACWPNDMPETLEKTTLGLDESEIEEEERRRAEERQRREIEQRSIEFAGHSLDTGDPSFAETLRRAPAVELGLIRNPHCQGGVDRPVTPKHPRAASAGRSTASLQPSKVGICEAAAPSKSAPGCPLSMVDTIDAPDPALGGVRRTHTDEGRASALSREGPRTNSCGCARPRGAQGRSRDSRTNQSP
jgi:hypothetical protein